MYPISIDTPRLALREIRNDDTDALNAIYGSEQATEHLSFEPRNRDQVAALIADALSQATVESRAVYALAVTLPGRSDLIGFARLAVEPHRAGQIGFALSPACWGRGYGTETVHLLLKLGFDYLDLHRVWGGQVTQECCLSRRHDEESDG